MTLISRVLTVSTGLTTTPTVNILLTKLILETAITLSEIGKNFTRVQTSLIPMERLATTRPFKAVQAHAT